MKNEKTDYTGCFDALGIGTAGTCMIVAFCLGFGQCSKTVDEGSGILVTADAIRITAQADLARIALETKEYNDEQQKIKELEAAKKLIAEASQ